MIPLKASLNLLLLALLVLKMNGQKDYDLLIRNVSIIDVKKGKTIPAQNVYIKGNKIAAISASGKAEKAALKTIDGTGKFLIPGLWDMHTHNWWQIHFSGHYVANGVLGVRNMYTPMRFIRPLKDSINKGLINGPKYFAAGRVLEGPKPGFKDWLVVDTKDKIKAALDTLQAEGSDFVKIYNKIPRDVYFELVKEVHRRGMTVQGHLPMAVTATEASEAGQKSLEHLLGIPDACTHDVLFKNKHEYNWYNAVMKEDDYGTLTINEELALNTLKTLKKNKTYVCPTLVVWYTYLHPDTLFENNSLLKKFPVDMAEYWRNSLQGYRKKDSSYKQMAIRKYENLKKTTYLLYKAGVPMLAGTDAINPYCYPGYSLHRELELLRECGIPDADILQMATLNAAQFFGLKNHGEIKAGFTASLVLLEENPLSDIRNTSKINTVFLNGKVLGKDVLIQMQR